MCRNCCRRCSRTTVVASVIFGVVYAIIVHRVLTLDEIPFFPRYEACSEP